MSLNNYSVISCNFHHGIWISPMYWVVLHYHPTFSSTSRGFEHCSIGGRISWGATPIAPQGKKTAGLDFTMENRDPSPWSDHTLGILNRHVLWSFTLHMEPALFTAHLSQVFREHRALAARWEMYSWCLAVDPLGFPRNGHRNRSERKTSQKAIVSGVSKM